MKKGILLTVAALTLTTFAGTALAKADAIFKEKCAMCHPDGGNAMKADKTLKKKDMEKNGLKKKADIVKYLRKPGPGMTAFDEKALPKKDAEELADYIMKTFK
jgi:cytochrome c6